MMRQTETAKHGRVRVWIAIAGLLGLGVWLVRRSGGEGAEAARVGEGAGGTAPAVLAGEGKRKPELLLDLRVAERATIAGTVRDPRGAPVAGAQVCAFSRSNWLAPSETRRPNCTRSERDGHYRIEGLLPVRQWVTASAPGYAPGVYVRGEGADRRATRST